MKKMMNKSFWIILIISIITLIALTIGVISLTKKSEKEFYSAGYIINSTASKTDKYYFDDNTKYKENVFDEYVFKDTDNKEVSSSKENFIHYSDKSLSFMKNGVILDLDNFNETLVPYYNITDKSIIKYNNGNYNIETADKTLVFHNFLGRITDNKYIVVGKDVRIKLAGNEKTVSGNYFELMFVEDGIVKIENEEGSYQVVTEGTTISIGDNIKIDLGDKSVSYGNETKLSLDEMTINGNENIDIKPTGKVKTEEKQKNNENGTDNSKENTNSKDDGKEDGNSTDNGKTTDNDTGNEQKDNNQTENNNINTEETEEKIDSVIKKEVIVNLVTAKIDADSLSTTFQTIDTGDFIKGNLELILQNITDPTDKIRKKEIVVNADTLQDVNFENLIPNCNYFMTIVEKNDISEKQYFQKMFITDTLNINTNLEMADTDTLEYSVEFDNEEIVSADVNLYQINGEPGNETLVKKHTVVNAANKNYVSFSGLNSDSMYRTVINNITYKNLNYSENNKIINGTNKTLKLAPTIGDISVVVDNDSQTFKLKIDKATDKDNSITKYIYKIYKELSVDNIEEAEPVYEFYKMRSQLNENLSNEEILTIDNKNIFSKTNYTYKVVAEYFDNYKYNEIETEFSSAFNLSSIPTVTFEADENGIEFDQINGTIKIKDNSCVIPAEGRSCNDRTNKFIVKYSSKYDEGEQSLNNPIFTASETETNVLEYKLSLDKLVQNTAYTFKVFAGVDDMSAEEIDGQRPIKEGEYIGTFTVTTKGIDALKMQNWNQNSYNYNTPISVNTELVSSVADSNITSKVNSITINLYRGKNTNNKIASYKLTGDQIIKNQEFEITSNKFIIDNEGNNITNLDVLRDISGGKLSEYYTIEVTDAYDATGMNEFTILNNTFVYTTPPALLLEDQLSKPQIIIDEITNIQTKSDEYVEEYGVRYDSKIGKDIVVGYKVTSVINDIAAIHNNYGYTPTKVNFYAYNNYKKLINSKNIDVTYDEEGNLNTSYTTYFFLGYGTDYNTKDNDLRRGNTYTFAFDLSIDTDNDGEKDIEFPSNKPTTNKMLARKQDPTFNMYIDNSSNNSITYKYSITDYDNALCKNKDDNKYYFYYTIGESEDIYQSEIEKSNDMKSFTISNLNNLDIYNINYYRANSKDSEPTLIKLGSYLFDGKYTAEDYNLGYRLEYGNFDNRLKIILDDNEFNNRISTYLVTLTSGSEKYQKVVSNINDSKNINTTDCGENKCIIIDYADIKNLKGKDVKVAVNAFYDTGYIGFSQPSKLGTYFQNLGLVENKDSSKLGYVYQTTNTTVPGKYITINNNGTYIETTNPKGILGFELKPSTKAGESWKLTTTNIVDYNNLTFAPYGTIISNDISVQPVQNGIYYINNKYTINPKVLDKVNIQTEDDNFKFTSITPKVTTTHKPTINGATINVDLSIDEDTLKDDFVKTDGEYKFYIDIYQKVECLPEEECEEKDELVKTIESNYEDISEVTFDELTPATKYSYKILADMNKNGEKVKTPLFDYNRAGYVEYISKFSTLNKDNILNKVNYEYKSKTNKENNIYSERTLTTKAYLKTNVNFDVHFEIYDINGELEYEYTLPNADIRKTEKNNIIADYIEDITGNDFVFGPDYHTLKITAITTDSKQNKLELYNETLNNNEIGKSFRELRDPIFTITSTASVEEKDGKLIPNITAKITVSDEDKVIKDGIYYVELQKATSSSGYENACPKNKEECMATVNLMDSKSNPTKEIRFENLSTDTSYIIYVYANTYRNNVSLSEEEKTKKVEVRKNQYTKSALGFSLGKVTPTAVSKDKLVITFTGASNIDEKIKGIAYSITVQGGQKVTSGSFGRIIIDEKETIPEGSPKTIDYKLDTNNYLTLEIKMPPGKSLGLNNHILMTYYYENVNGKLVAFEINNVPVIEYGVIYNGN